MDRAKKPGKNLGLTSWPIRFSSFRHFTYLAWTISWVFIDGILEIQEPVESSFGYLSQETGLGGLP
jgi:hypothetical protein